jgi:serpin B
MLAKRADLISREYRALVRDKYAAAVFEGAGLDEINGWVKERTEGKIDRILDSLAPGAAAVLLNAVYLKAAWASAFAKGATHDSDFKLASGAKVRVPTMHQQAPFPVVERAGYRAIRLDYTVRALGMIVVLPDEVDGADAVTRQLGTGEIAGLAAALKGAPHHPVAVALPRFKTAFRAGFVEPFKRAGMTLAFDESADFGGMTGKVADKEGVKIGEIQHRATLEVVEQGTEAAAATAVVMLPARASPLKEPPKATPFVVDRPFLFYIVDDASGAILFQGRIVDPRAS